MKRTLILAGALAMAAAQADTLTLPSIELDASQTQQNGTLIWTATEDFSKTSLTNYSLTFSLEKDPGTTDAAFFTTWGGNYLMGLLLCTDGSGNITLRHDQEKTAFTDANVPSVAWTEGGKYTLTVIDSKAYLYAGTEVPTSTPTSCVDLSLAEFSTTSKGGDAAPDCPWTLTSGTAKLWANGQNATVAKTPSTFYTLTDLSNVTAAQYFSAPTDNTDTVPEPATATLSLLALAGLAARRRRR